MSDITKETYEQIAVEWTKHHQKDSWWTDVTDTFISLLPPEAKVLDVGCAGGYKSEYLVKHNVQVVGIDFSEKMIEIAKKRVPEAEFHVADMRNVELSLGVFDGIFMQASLLHIRKEEALSVLFGLCRLLKSGGCLCIAVKEQTVGKKDEEIVIENNNHNHRRFFSYFTMDELKHYMSDLHMDIQYERKEGIWLQIIGRKK